MPCRCHSGKIGDFLLDFQGCTFLSILAETIRIPVDSSWFGRGEFRSKKRGDSLSKRIVGFPEHITRNSAQVLVSQVPFELWTCFQIPFTGLYHCLPLYDAHVEMISLKKLTQQLSCQVPRFEVILAPLEILLLQQKWPLAPFCNEHMPLVRSSSLAIGNFCMAAVTWDGQAWSSGNSITCSKDLVIYMYIDHRNVQFLDWDSLSGVWGRAWRSHALWSSWHYEQATWRKRPCASSEDMWKHVQTRLRLMSYHEHPSWFRIH